MAAAGPGRNPAAAGAKNATAETVHILLVEVGRRAGDGLPEGASGAALLCFCAAPSEARAVEETVRLVREAGMAPIEVESFGSEDAPEGIALGPEERRLIARARDENAVVVAAVESFGG